MTPHDELPEPKRGEWDVDALWSRVRARTVEAAEGVEGARTPHAAELPAPSSQRRVSRRIYAYAASLAVCAASAVFLARWHNRSASAAADTAPGEYRTSRGQYATVRLADSSMVTLAPESRLTIAASYGDGTREITLEGEAVFSVRHDAACPFRVHARGALVEDIGTRFDLRAYPGDATTVVAVVEGAVSVGAHAVVLHAGDVGTLDGEGKVTAERSSRVSSYLDWTDGRLSFVDRPLPEVLRTIARWYDLDVRVDDPRLARRLITAEFAHQSPEEMLAALAVTMDATVERHGRVVTLRPR